MKKWFCLLGGVTAVLILVFILNSSARRVSDGEASAQSQVIPVSPSEEDAFPWDNRVPERYEEAGPDSTNIAAGSAASNAISKKGGSGSVSARKP